MHSMHCDSPSRLNVTSRSRPILRQHSRLQPSPWLYGEITPRSSNSCWLISTKVVHSYCRTIFQNKITSQMRIITSKLMETKLEQVGKWKGNNSIPSIPMSSYRVGSMVRDGCSGYTRIMLKMVGYTRIMLLMVQLGNDFDDFLCNINRSHWKGEKIAPSRIKPGIVHLLDVVSVVMTHCNIFLALLRGYCTSDQFCDCLCIFLKNYNTLVTSKICFL